MFTPIMFMLLPIFIALVFSRRLAVYVAISIAVLFGWFISSAFGIMLAFMSGSADEIRSFPMDVTMTMQFIGGLEVDTLYQMFLAPYIFVVDAVVAVIKLNIHAKSFIMTFPPVAYTVMVFRFIRSFSK